MAGVPAVPVGGSVYSLRRAVNNPNRGTFEMVKAWQCGPGSAERNDLIAKWMQNPDCVAVTMEMVKRDFFREQFD